MILITTTLNQRLVRNPFKKQEQQERRQTLNDSLEYHMLVNAMEGRAGWTPSTRFASAVGSAINGHLPASRFHAAGRARQREGITEGGIEQLIKDWLPTDINPIVELLGIMKTSSTIVIAWNGYYSAVENLGARKHIALKKSDAWDHRLSAKQDFFFNSGESEPCRMANLVALDSHLAISHHFSIPGKIKKPPSLSRLAKYLGVEGAAGAEVSTVYESEGCIPIGQVARHVGCHQRTLERRLHELGLTAESLRQAVRLLRATARLSSPDSLTTIAVDEGFSDLAHMTRAFRMSTGMPPSKLKRLLAEDEAAHQSWKA